MEKRIKGVFYKTCRHCGKDFIPSGRYCRVCDKCYKKHMKNNGKKKTNKVSE